MHKRGYADADANADADGSALKIICPLPPLVGTIRKPELSCLYATRRLVLFYISTKYHKNIQRVFDLQSGHEING